MLALAHGIGLLGFLCHHWLLITRTVVTRPRAIELKPSRRQGHDGRSRTNDGDVGDIPDEQAPIVDEVDHMAAKESGLPGESINEVADGTAQHESECRGPPHGAQSPRHPEHDHDDDQGHRGEDPGLARGEGERSTGIANEHESQPAPQQIDPLRIGQRSDRPCLRQLIDDDDPHCETPQDEERAARRAQAHLRRPLGGAPTHGIATSIGSTLRRAAGGRGFRRLTHGSSSRWAA